MAHPVFSLFSLSDRHQALAQALLDLGQAHLFEGWSSAGADESDKARFFAQIDGFQSHYPGGLAAYVHNAVKLLAESRQGLNPYDGFVPEKPDTVDLSAFGADFETAENVGFSAAQGLAVVLVAGGLGERLGYSGIKVDIPVEVTTQTSYLQLYAEWILALGRRAGVEVPFLIMTSRDTDAATRRSLEQHHYFGLKTSQVHLIRQELVPALIDNEARFAREGLYEVAAKPHGHGDVHMLLASSGLAARLAAEGKTHLLFLQDTNAQALQAALALLGVSVQKQYAFNTLAVARIPGEAVGAVTRLTPKAGSGRTAITINVEYNQLDALLKEAGLGGDRADASGFSPFAGNTNVLVVDLQRYAPLLARTRGIVAEFVNPKYADEKRTTFKKPARLETMMQDLPKLFPEDWKVGVTVFDRAFAFSADKNNLADARAKAAAGGPPESGASAESDFYQGHRTRLRLAGASVAEGESVPIQGIPFQRGARVVLHSSFALTQADLRARVRGLRLEADATLIVSGDVQLDQVAVAAGASLLVCSEAGSSLQVRDAEVRNAGHALIPLSEDEMKGGAPEDLRLRGFRMEKREGLELKAEGGGSWISAGGAAPKRTTP